MLELTFAYLAAGILIGALFLLALRNQKQGWRKQRGVWWEAQSQAAVAAFEASVVSPPVEHLGDLVRLQQSLAHDSEPVPTEQLTHSR